MKINQFAQHQELAHGPGCITDVNKTFQVVDICKFWVIFYLTDNYSNADKFD